MSIARGLVGWWRLDGNLTDASGNGNHGTVGAGSAAYAAGVYGRAWDNDATRYAVLDSLDGSWHAGGYTVSMWLKPTEGSYLIFGSSNDGNSNVIRIWVGREANRIDVFQRSTSGEASASAEIIIPSAYTVGQWFHIAVRTNADTNKGEVYLNGNLAGVTPGTLNVANLTSLQYPMFVGGFNNRGVLHTITPVYVGQIDNLIIYNRALTPSEIKTLYALGSPL